MANSPETSNNKATLAEPVRIGLDDQQRQGVVEALADILSDQHVLYIKLRNFHWNLVGPRFHSLHEFFEKQYRTLEAAIDETAERIRMLGGVSPGTMAAFIDRASLVECPAVLIQGDDALRALIADHESCIRTLRGKIALVEDELDDAGTGDFLTGLMQQHEMDAWMLRSFVDRATDG